MAGGQQPNPFESSGIDKKAVEALLLDTDADSLKLAINGVKRALAKALHPDRSPLSTQSEYLNELLKANQILDGLDSGDLVTFAQAYVSTKTRRSKAQRTEEVTSKDFHDGSILFAIRDMLHTAGESIPSSRNKLILVRPVNFLSDKKPEDYSGEPYGWYPPSTAEVYLFHVDDNGETSYRTFKQVSGVIIYAKEAGRKITDEEYSQHNKALSEKVKSILLPIIENTANVYLSKNILLMKKGSSITFFDSRSGRQIGAVELNEPIPGLKDGLHIYGTDTDCLHSEYFQEDESKDNQNPDLYIAGAISSDFIALENRRIYERVTPLKRPTLPVNKRSKEGLSLYPIIDPLIKHAQKYYSPEIDKNTFIEYEENPEKRKIKGSYLIAVNEQGDLVIVGLIVESVNSK